MDESGRKKMCVFGSFSYNPEISFLLSYSAEEREREKNARWYSGDRKAMMRERAAEEIMRLVEDSCLTQRGSPCINQTSVLSALVRERFLVPEHRSVNYQVLNATVRLSFVRLHDRKIITSNIIPLREIVVWCQSIWTSCTHSPIRVGGRLQLRQGEISLTANCD